jgi:uncharacterized integral membrane protein
MATEERPAQGAPPPKPGPPTQPKRPAAETARLIGFGLIAAYLIAFVVENSKSIDIHFVFFTAHVSLIWALILAALLGVLLDRLFQRRARRKAKQKSG